MKLPHLLFLLSAFLVLGHAAAFGQGRRPGRHDAASASASPALSPSPSPYQSAARASVSLTASVSGSITATSSPSVSPSRHPSRSAAASRSPLPSAPFEGQIMPFVPPQFSVMTNISGDNFQLIFVDEAQNKTRTQQLPEATGANEVFDYNQGKTYFVVASKCTVKELQHGFRNIIMPALYNYTGEATVLGTPCRAYESLSFLDNIEPSCYYSRLEDDAPVLLHYNGSIFSAGYDVYYTAFSAGPQDASTFNVPKTCGSLKSDE